MTTLINTAAATQTRKISFRPLAWLRAFDNAYIQKMRFDGLDARELDDIGITAKERDAAFYGQFVRPDNR